MEATHYRRTEDGLIECGVCQHRCRIQAGKTGFCRLRKSDGSGLLLNDSLSSACIDPIEKKPLYHFHPGSMVLSLGGIGCNFRCRHCQNWSISQTDIQTGQWLSPEEAVRLAKEEGCGGLAWTYNEPTMWFEYALEGMRLAKEAGLYTVFVTNGFMTPEALELMAPYLDAFRVDLKGFSDRAYAELCRINGWRGILDVAVRAKDRGMHLEVVTNLVPTINDEPDDIQALASWIYANLGPKTPWHVTRFHPAYELDEIPATPLERIEAACRIGTDAGLQFVYPGNVPHHPREHTSCPACGRTMIERSGFRARPRAVTSDGRCAHDGEFLNIRGPIQ